MSTLSHSVRTKIDDWLKRYPADQKQSAVLEALRWAQEENHDYLTTALMDAVADYLGMPRIAVYEVVSFYGAFHLEPVGKKILHLCTTVSCKLRGADDIAAHCKKRLGIDFNETTADGQWTLKEIECLAACTKAPVAMVGNQYHEELTLEKIDQLLDSHHE